MRGMGDHRLMVWIGMDGESHLHCVAEGCGYLEVTFGGHSGLDDMTVDDLIVVQLAHRAEVAARLLT